MQYYQYEFDNKDRHNLGVNPHYYIPLPHFQLPKSCALLVGQRWSELEYPSVHTKTTGRVGCSGAPNYGSLWKAGYPKIPRSGSPWFFSMAFHGHNLQKITHFSTSLDKLMDCPHLVGGWPTPLKMMEVVSWDYDILMTFPTEWKVIKFHGSSHHQPDNLVGYSHVPPFQRITWGLGEQIQMSIPWGSKLLHPHHIFLPQLPKSIRSSWQPLRRSAMS